MNASAGTLLVLGLNTLIAVTLVTAFGVLVSGLVCRNVHLRHALLRVALVGVLLAPVAAWLGANRLALWRWSPSTAASQAVPRYDVALSSNSVPSADLADVFSNDNGPKQSARSGVPLLPPLFDTKRVAPDPQTVAQKSDGDTKSKWSLVWITGLGIWAAGAMVVVVQLSRSLVRVARLRRDALGVKDVRLETSLRGAVARLRMSRAPSLTRSTLVSAPVAIGPWRRTLVFPSQLVSRFKPDELDAVLLHELAHFKFAHHYWAALKALARVVFWWHPVVHVLLNSLSDAEEEVCDDVVRNCQGSGMVLAELLIDFARRRQTLPVGIGFWRRSGFARRIENLLHGEEQQMKATIRRYVIVAASALGVACCGTVLGFKPVESDGHLVRIGRADSSDKFQQTRQTLQSFEQQAEGPSQEAATVQSGQVKRVPQAANPQARTPQALTPQTTAPNPAGRANGPSAQPSNLSPQGQIQAARGPQIQSSVPPQRKKTPPAPIVYGNSRSSKRWVTLKSGLRVAVDNGIAFQNTKVYLSLTWDLVAEDANSHKPLWSHSVGAFWNRLSFERAKTKDGKRVWAVTLRSTRSRSLFERYDMRTGERLTQKVKLPSGKQIKPVKVWHGDDALNIKGHYQVVHNQKDWEAARRKLFQGAKMGPKATDNIDFQRNFVFILSIGKTINCSGVEADSVFVDKSRVLLRAQQNFYQSIEPPGGSPRPADHAYGIFVLPRTAARKLMIEYNRQPYIGGPAIWKKSREFSLVDNQRQGSP